MRRNVPSKVLIGLCSSIGCLLIIFMLFIDRADPPWLCRTTSALLHFFILNCFSWMMVEATTLYLKVVKVMGEYTSNFMIKATVGTFGKSTVRIQLEYIKHKIFSQTSNDNLLLHYCRNNRFFIC